MSLDTNLPPPVPPGPSMMVDGKPVPATIAPAVADVAPVLPWMVPKLRAVDRVLAAGLGDALIAALGSNAVAKLRFDSATEIASNDPNARAMLQAIGADPDAVLAP